MPKTAWQVADLLEEICKNADPHHVTRNIFQRYYYNIRQQSSPGPNMIAPDHERKWLKIIYWISVETAMKGVDGTPEELVAWAQTGLADGQEISLGKNPINVLSFIITQTFKDPVIYQDYMDLCEQMRIRLLKMIRDE